MTNDIALLKLARDVEFIPQVLEPVCLPLAFDKYDVAKKGRASTATFASTFLHKLRSQFTPN